MSHEASTALILFALSAVTLIADLPDGGAFLFNARFATFAVLLSSPAAVPRDDGAGQEQSLAAVKSEDLGGGAKKSSQSKSSSSGSKSGSTRGKSKASGSTSKASSKSRAKAKK